jgi:hypothetical protein
MRCMHALVSAVGSGGPTTAEQAHHLARCIRRNPHRR